MSSTTELTETKERLLNAGEVLFANHGFAGTSVRAVVSAANTNLNAINYHFGSKEGFFQAVVERVVNPINALQLQRLTALETDRRRLGGVPSVEELIDAYASPCLEFIERDEERARIVLRLFARVQGGDTGSVHLRELGSAEAPDWQEAGPEQRYMAAFARVLPQLSYEELWWRFQANRVVILFHWVLIEGAHRPAVRDFRAWMLTYLSAAMGAPGVQNPFRNE